MEEFSPELVRAQAEVFEIQKAREVEGTNENEVGLIENKELGISYIETYEELSSEIQELTGLRRLKRRKILSYPKDFYEEQKRGKNIFEKGFSVESHADTWRFLTDGRFPTYKTWTHVMAADRMKNFDMINLIESVKSGGYYEEFFPPNMSEGIPINFFEKTENNEIVPMNETKVKSLSKEDGKKCLSFFSMSVACNNEVGIYADRLDPHINAPVFVFGGRNKLFVDYINKIRENPETKKILELSKWTVDDPLEIVTVDSPDYEKYKSLFQESPSKPPASFPRPKFDVEKASVLEKDLKLRNNISTLDFLFDEQEIVNIHHPWIPIVRHPEIKPFRWSHSELVIMPEERELEIIFFESE